MNRDYIPFDTDGEPRNAPREREELDNYEYAKLLAESAAARERNIRELAEHESALGFDLAREERRRLIREVDQTKKGGQ